MISDFTGLGLVGSWLRERLSMKKSSSDVPPNGVVIGTTGRGLPVLWPAPSAEQASHVTVLAASGAGKTILVAHALLSEMLLDHEEADHEPEAVLIVDPKGDLAVAILHGLAATAPHRLADVVYLDPFSASAFPFSVSKLALGKTPLDIRAAQLASLVGEVSTATGSQRHLGLGARQVDALQNCLLGALDCDHPQASILWALDALCDPKGLKALAKVTRSIRARSFLQTANLSDELRASCAARIRAAFSASDDLQRLVTAPSSIQFADLTSPGRLVLVDLGAPTGGLVSLTAFWANMLVRLAAEHLLERPSPWTGHHVRLVVDEAQVVAPVLSDVAERVLTTGRSRGVSLVTMSQGTTLIADASDTLLRVLMTNTPTRIVGRLSAPDAALFAKELSPKRGTDEPAKTVREKFTTTVTNLPDREFVLLTPGGRERFRSIDVDLDKWRGAAEARADEIAAVKSRLALPATTTPRLTLKQAVAALEEKKTTARRPAAPGPASPARSLWG